MLIIISNFHNKVLNGNFDDNDVFEFKKVIEPYMEQIEIELEMCEKYIQIAENKNDMKALRQLLTTKKELQRQLQRIKYKMQVDFGQKYYSAEAPND